MSDWQTLIYAAQAKGYKVSHSEEAEGWVITTPKALRKPSQELGTYPCERSAWRGAAFYAAQE